MRFPNLKPYTKPSSELVSEAAEDAEDLGAFEERAKEPDLSFQDVLKNLKQQGKI